MLAAVGVAVAAAAAAYTDVTRGRIPNAIVIVLLSYGLTLRAHDGSHAFFGGLLIGALTFALGAVLFSLRIIGGGDVKFIAAAAAGLGWPDALTFVLYTVLAGGVLGIIVGLARGKLRTIWRNVWAFILPVLAGMRPARPLAAAGKMPYALAIFAGAAALALGNFFALHLRIPL